MLTLTLRPYYYGKKLTVEYPINNYILSFMLINSTHLLKLLVIIIQAVWYLRSAINGISYLHQIVPTWIFDVWLHRLSLDRAVSFASFTRNFYDHLKDSRTQTLSATQPKRGLVTVLFCCFILHSTANLLGYVSHPAKYRLNKIEHFELFFLEIVVVTL